MAHENFRGGIAMGNDSVSQAYCPGCGEDVDVFVMTVEGVEGLEEKRCIHCGLTLERNKAVEQPVIKTFKHVISADDSRIIQSILSEMLLEAKVAEHVDICNNGMEFLSVITKQYLDKEKIDLVILDVNMPILNGISAAIALRALEKGFGIPPVPIMFFTVKKCDETFQKVLNFCQPSRYLNKGVSSSPAEIVRRVSEVATRLVHTK
jgi:CheY-like chemotaxis protein